MLLVRGSNEATDWKINITDELISYSYQSIKTPNLDAGDSVTGAAHKGWVEGARAILLTYGVLEIVHMLLIEGFTVKTVGHSLGI